MPRWCCLGCGSTGLSDPSPYPCLLGGTFTHQGGPHLWNQDSQRIGYHCFFKALRVKHIMKILQTATVKNKNKITHAHAHTHILPEHPPPNYFYRIIIQLRKRTTSLLALAPPSHVHSAAPAKDTAEFKERPGRQFGSLLPAPTTFSQPRNQAKVLSGIPDIPLPRKDVKKMGGAKMKMLDFFFNSQFYQLKIKVSANSDSRSHVVMWIHTGQRT